MKIILSRKGFDSSNGGAPSPIFRYPDGTARLLSLPIPGGRSTCEYADIQWDGGNFRDLISSLRRRHKPSLPDQFHPHLDPDLIAGALRNRHPDWRPIYGQSGAQETQLRNCDVHDPDDPENRPLFLFFGWFREVRNTATGYSYVNRSPHIHAFFGWLQVERKVELDGQRQDVARELPWTADHPHVACSDYDALPNSIYIAPKPGSRTDRLILAGRDTGLPAAGAFSRFEAELHTLTEPGKTRRYWLLPAWFYRDGSPKLGMHSDLRRWTMSDDPRAVQLRSVDLGQEFVFESKEHGETQPLEWIERIVRAGQPGVMVVGR